MSDPFRVQCKDCPTLQEVERERDALKEALKPFAAITPSRFYAADGSEKEGYFAYRALLAEDKAEFTGEDLARTRTALAGTPVKTQPDNKPDNASNPLQTPNVSDPDQAPQFTCGDCTLHQKSIPFDFCKMKIGSYFRREAYEKACNSISLRASASSEKEAI